MYLTYLLLYFLNLFNKNIYKIILLIFKKRIWVKFSRMWLSYTFSFRNFILNKIKEYIINNN